MIYSKYLKEQQKSTQTIDEINEIHPSLKFTFNHTSPDEESEEDGCNCMKKKAIPFLDTLLSIENLNRSIPQRNRQK